MKGLVFKEKGPAEEVIAYEEVPLKNPNRDDILVEILASPINPNDFMFIEKNYRIAPEFPQVAGLEGCGRIIKNPTDHHFPIGSLVAFRHKGVWTEQAYIPKEKLILLPENYPIHKAAQFGLNPFTAWALLEQSEALANDWIILSAGASSVSKLIIQFAQRKGIKTLALIRNELKKHELYSLGASQVALENEGILENLKAKCFIDAVGGELASRIIPHLTVNGKVIAYGLMSTQNVQYYNAQLIFKLLKIQGFGIDAWFQSKSAEELQFIIEEIITITQEQNFKLDYDTQYDLANFREAFLKAKSNKVIFNIGNK